MTGVLICFILLVHVLDAPLVRVSPEAYNAAIGTYNDPVLGLGAAGLVAPIGAAVAHYAGCLPRLRAEVAPRPA